MQAIEFQTKVQDGVVRLPTEARLAEGQPVRVVLLYDAVEHAAVAPAETDDHRQGSIARLMRNPLVVSGFTPLSRDEAHER